MSEPRCKACRDTPCSGTHMHCDRSCPGCGCADEHAEGCALDLEQLNALEMLGYYDADLNDSDDWESEP